MAATAAAARTRRPSRQRTPRRSSQDASQSESQLSVPVDKQTDYHWASCYFRFGSSDFIMEPEIFAQLKKYFQAGGNPEQVIELLSKNYLAVAQMANLMAEWLILAGAEINDVQQQVHELRPKRPKEVLFICLRFRPARLRTICTT